MQPTRGVCCHAQGNGAGSDTIKANLFRERLAMFTAAAALCYR